ncbi:hypothetical protein N7457_003276 [Penicillium paradoxum]|uniref:uncharacterized protein n=1 Tax=Penicillium paradoxum TaxID=176176 RepID=UPI002549AD42|nr:uncharacterized protein N7457_003276 [Penicillium paradoxum]KAJ5788286.1 hypothetical protein N7457_003276 [Penicillium paradoxum]
MLNFQKSLLRAWFLASGLLALTEAEVTCNEETVHALANPSFETGDLTGWKSMLASGGPSLGNVVAGDAFDGDYRFTIQATSIYTYLKQTLSDLDTTKPYDLSLDYRIQTTQPVRPSNPAQICYLGWSKDTWSSWVVPRTTISLASTDAQWKSLSIQWQPTSSIQDLYLVFACTHPGVTIDLDNFQLPIGSKSVCTTSIPPSASSTITSALPTSAAPTSESVTTSSVSVSQAPASSPAETSPSSSTSLPGQSSTLIVVPTSSPVEITVSQSVHLSSSAASVPSPSSVAVPPSLISTSASASITIHPSSIVPPSIQSSSVVSLPGQVPSSVSSSQSLATSQTASPSVNPHQPGSPSGSGPFVPSQTIPSGGPGPVTGGPSLTNGPGIPASTPNVPLTTSTVLTTRTFTITACPSTVIHCPAASKTTSVTTETVVAYTTVCPVTKTEQPIQATQTTSSIFSTRIATVTSCVDHQQYCALPHRSTQLVTETVLVSTTVYLAPVPTANREPIFVDNNGFYRSPPKATQISSVSTGSDVGGQVPADGAVNLPGLGPEVTRTQIVFSTIFVTQPILATVCPPAPTGSSSAQPQPRPSSVRPVYF